MDIDSRSVGNVAEMIFRREPEKPRHPPFLWTPELRLKIGKTPVFYAWVRLQNVGIKRAWQAGDPHQVRLSRAFGNVVGMDFFTIIDFDNESSRRRDVLLEPRDLPTGSVGWVELDDGRAPNLPRSVRVTLKASQEAVTELETASQWAMITGKMIDVQLHGIDLAGRVDEIGVCRTIALTSALWSHTIDFPGATPIQALQWEGF